MPRDVAVLVGSVRKDSLNRRHARALIALAPSTLALEIVPVGHLPLYSPDLDGQPPAQWSQFRDRIKRTDAVLFVTPEHNRSVPAAMPQPEVYIGHADKLFDADGKLANEGTAKFLRVFLDAFDKWIMANRQG